MLTNIEIEELVQAELDSVEEILLNKSLLPPSYSIEGLKNHVKSIFCSCGPEEVNLSFKIF